MDIRVEFEGLVSAMEPPGDEGIRLESASSSPTSSSLASPSLYSQHNNNSPTYPSIYLNDNQTESSSTVDQHEQVMDKQFDSSENSLNLLEANFTLPSAHTDSNNSDTSFTTFNNSLQLESIHQTAIEVIETIPKSPINLSSSIFTPSSPTHADLPEPSSLVSINKKRMLELPDSALPSPKKPKLNDFPEMDETGPLEDQEDLNQDTQINNHDVPTEIVLMEDEMMEEDAEQFFFEKTREIQEFTLEPTESLLTSSSGELEVFKLIPTPLQKGKAGSGSKGGPKSSKKQPHAPPAPLAPLAVVTRNRALNFSANCEELKVPEQSLGIPKFMGSKHVRAIEIPSWRIVSTYEDEEDIRDRYQAITKTLKPLQSNNIRSTTNIETGKGANGEAGNGTLKNVASLMKTEETKPENHSQQEPTSSINSSNNKEATSVINSSYQQGDSAPSINSSSHLVEPTSTGPISVLNEVQTNSIENEIVITKETSLMAGSSLEQVSTAEIKGVVVEDILISPIESSSSTGIKTESIDGSKMNIDESKESINESMNLDETKMNGDEPPKASSESHDSSIDAITSQPEPTSSLKTYSKNNIMNGVDIKDGEVGNSSPPEAVKSVDEVGKSCLQTSQEKPSSEVQLTLNSLERYFYRLLRSKPTYTTSETNGTTITDSNQEDSKKTVSAEKETLDGAQQLPAPSVEPSLIETSPSNDENKMEVDVAELAQSEEHKLNINETLNDPITQELIDNTPTEMMTDKISAVEDDTNLHDSSDEFDGVEMDDHFYASRHYKQEILERLGWDVGPGSHKFKETDRHMTIPEFYASPFAKTYVSVGGNGKLLAQEMWAENFKFVKPRRKPKAKESTATTPSSSKGSSSADLKNSLVDKSPKTSKGTPKGKNLKVTGLGKGKSASSINRASPSSNASPLSASQPAATTTAGASPPPPPTTTSIVSPLKPSSTPPTKPFVVKLKSQDGSSMVLGSSPTLTTSPPTVLVSLGSKGRPVGGKGRPVVPGKGHPVTSHQSAGGKSYPKSTSGKSYPTPTIGTSASGKAYPTSAGGQLYPKSTGGKSYPTSSVGAKGRPLPLLPSATQHNFHGGKGTARGGKGTAHGSVQPASRGGKGNVAVLSWGGKGVPQASRGGKGVPPNGNASTTIVPRVGAGGKGPRHVVPSQQQQSRPTGKGSLYSVPTHPKVGGKVPKIASNLAVVAKNTSSSSNLLASSYLVGGIPPIALGVADAHSSKMTHKKGSVKKPTAPIPPGYVYKPRAPLPRQHQLDITQPSYHGYSQAPTSGSMLPPASYPSAAAYTAPPAHPKSQKQPKQTAAMIPANHATASHKPGSTTTKITFGSSGAYKVGLSNNRVSPTASFVINQPPKDTTPSNPAGTTWKTNILSSPYIKTLGSPPDPFKLDPTAPPSPYHPHVHTTRDSMTTTVISPPRQPVASIHQNINNNAVSSPYITTPRMRSLPPPPPSSTDQFSSSNDSNTSAPTASVTRTGSTKLVLKVGPKLNPAPSQQS